jgi:hypothetical protein
MMMMMMATTMRATTDKVTCRTAAYVAIFLVYVSLSTLHSASAWRNDRRKFFFLHFLSIFFISFLLITHV